MVAATPAAGGRGSSRHGGFRQLVAGIVVTALFSAPVTAQESWLPGPVRDSLVESVASKLTEIDTDGRLSEDRVRSAAEVSVDGVAMRLELLGKDRILEIAPSFSDLEMPTNGSSALDALASYQLCSLPFDASFADETPRPNRYDERAWSLFLAAAIYVVSGYLRQFYLEDGISDEDAAALLGGEEMMALRQRVGSSAALLQDVRLRCSDPLIEIMS